MCDLNSRIKSFKEECGLSAESIIANGLGLESSGKKYRCPNGYAHRHGDRTPSMSFDKKLLRFKCFGCGHTVDIFSYYKEHLNYSIDEILGTREVSKSRDSFYSEALKVGALTDSCLKYINERGIDSETVKAFNLGTYKGKIAFPYYKFEAVVGYKLREPVANPNGAKMTNIKGSKPFLFGMNNLDFEGDLIVCEGEFDAMVLYQCGFKNVLSVGAGANSIKSIFEQGTEIFRQFKNIIIVSDNDEAGSKMDVDAVSILGKKAKLIDKKLYELNDINDEFLKNGKEKVVKIIDSARFKIEGRRDVDIVPYRSLKTLQGSYVPTGINSVDNALNDLEPRRVTLVTGRSNGGKTTFVKQVIVNAIDKGNKVYLMNGENDSDMLLNEIYKTIIGRDDMLYKAVKINKRQFKEPKPLVLEAIKSWHKNKLYMFNKGESRLKSPKELYLMLQQEIKYNSYDLVVIDNLMSILSVTATEKYEQQADFTQMLCDLSKAYNTHIVLVLHPNKTYTKGMDLEMEQISGSSDIYNKADNIIAVLREYDQGKNDNGINGYIQVIKNRYYSELPKIKTYYDKETGLLLENDNDQILSYSFKFQKDLDEVKKVMNNKQMTL